MYMIFCKMTGRYLDKTFSDKKTAQVWFKHNNLSTWAYEIVKK